MLHNMDGGFGQLELDVCTAAITRRKASPFNAGYLMFWLARLVLFTVDDIINARFGNEASLSMDCHWRHLRVTLITSV